MSALNFDKVLARLEGVTEDMGTRVAQVGWFDTAKYPDGTPVAYVAAIQEKGSPGNGIPPRPFIRPTIEDQKAAWSKTIGDGLRQVILGKLTTEQVLDGVGLQAAGDIGAEIERGSFDPLSPITLMLRKMRDDDPSLVVTGKTVGEAAARVAAGEEGSTRTTPLQDSGLLLATLTHLVGDA